MKSANRRRPEIKTAGKIVGRGKITERHVHQFQIACLELERTRRLKELGVASQRVQELNERLEQINQEMTAHVAAMPPLPTHCVPSVESPTALLVLPNKAPGHRQNGSKESSQTDGKRRTLRY